MFVLAGPAFVALSVARVDLRGVAA